MLGVVFCEHFNFPTHMSLEEELYARGSFFSVQILKSLLHFWTPSGTPSKHIKISYEAKKFSIIGH